MSSVKTFESSQTDETYMLNTPEDFGLRPKVSGQSKTGCNLRTIRIVLAILASITVIVGTTLGIVRSIKKQGLEPIADSRCSTGWTEYHFGSKRKCFKNIGLHRVDQARQKCAELGAALPLPRSDRERTDLVATLESLDIASNGYCNTTI